MSCECGSPCNVFPDCPARTAGTIEVTVDGVDVTMVTDPDEVKRIASLVDPPVLDAAKTFAYLPVSNELLIDSVMANYWAALLWTPDTRTPNEIRRANLQRDRIRDRAYRDADRLHAATYDKAPSLLRPLLVLHEPRHGYSDPVCGECLDGGSEPESMAWPCPTYELARKLAFDESGQSMKFFVKGRPISQGSKVAGVARNGRAFLREADDKHLRPWRIDIIGEAGKRMREVGWVPPVDAEVECVFYFERPRNQYRTGRFAHLLRDDAPARPAVKPDVDKLSRAVLDSLTGARVFADDAQVTRLISDKRYGIPGVAIRITNREDQLL